MFVYNDNISFIYIKELSIMKKATAVFQSIIYIFCLICAIAYLIAGLAFVSSNKTVNILAPLGWSAGGYFLFFTLLYLTVLGLFYFLFRLFPDEPSRRLHMLLLSAAALLIGLTAFFTPYAPSHDSAEMHDVLRCLLNYGELTAYQSAYSRFFITNKFAVYFYYPLVWLFHHVYWGVKITNLLCLYIILGMTAGISHRLFGPGYGVKSFLILSVFAPYMLLTGPYIYLPAMLLASTGLFFYLSKKLLPRLFSYLILALLFLMRPTALGFILVFIVIRTLLYLPEKKAFLSSAGSLALLLLICFLVKAGAGALAYRSGFHIYPKLNNSAALWTFELGTRPQGPDTGVCTYSALNPPDNLKEDPITQDFNALWRLYLEENPDNYDAVLARQENLKKSLADRFKTEILHSPETFFTFLNAKAVNLFADRYKGYYYAANVYSPSFERELYKNYQFRYFAYENMLLFLFFVSTLLTSAIGIIRLRRKQPHTRGIAAVFSLGAILTALAMLLFTEVSKKYICDFFIPMMIVICYSLITMTAALRIRAQKILPAFDRKPILLRTISLSVLFLCAGILAYANNLGNLDPFKDCHTSLTPSSDHSENYTHTLTIEFSEPIEEEGYYIRTDTHEMISLTGKSAVSIPCNTRDSFQLSVITPYETALQEKVRSGTVYDLPYLMPFDIRFSDYYSG